QGSDQPAELVAGLGPLGHVACRSLEYVEHAVEIGREHPSPFLLGAVDEGAASAATDAGIGEAAVDAAEGVEGCLHHGLERGGIADVAELGCDLAWAGLHRRCGVGVFFRVAAPDRDVAARGV